MSCTLQHTAASPACSHMLQQLTGDLAMPEAQEELANGLVLHRMLNVCCCAPSQAGCN
jgi:hypothetical protein